MSASKILLIILGVIVAGGCLISGCVVGGYNRAVTLDEATKTAWAQVENQLQRRYDLIPNAVAAVKGMKEHEQEVFLGVAKAREAYTQALLVAMGEDTLNFRMKSSRVKVNQVQESGAKILVTACENCHTQLSDLNDHYEMGVEVKFLSSMISDALMA